MDLFFDESPHTPLRINAKNYKNFVIGDACNLPFRTSSFDIVHAAHLIEHLLIPTNCISEMKRVTKKYAIFKVLNNPSIFEYREHFYSWSLTSFKNLLKYYFPIVNIRSNTNLDNLQKRKAFKLINRIYALRYISLRFLSKILALELLAQCKLVKKYD